MSADNEVKLLPNVALENELNKPERMNKPALLIFVHVEVEEPFVLSRSTGHPERALRS